jgi:hypothetical protein
VKPGSAYCYCNRCFLGPWPPEVHKSCLSVGKLSRPGCSRLAQASSIFIGFRSLSVAVSRNVASISQPLRLRSNANLLAPIFSSRCTLSHDPNSVSRDYKLLLGYRSLLLASRLALRTFLFVFSGNPPIISRPTYDCSI